MEQDSCQSESLHSDDSAFAKTPIRGASDEEDGLAGDTSDSSSSGGSAHFNEQGAKTYFHVWSDMLTCNEMSLLDQRAGEEVPNYVEGDEARNPNVHPPLSIDTSLPCPLIQFGPVPKRRQQGGRADVPPAAATAAAANVGEEKAATTTELAGDAEAAPEVAPPTTLASGHIHHHHHQTAEDCGHDERCCDFTLIAAKNKERLRLQEKQRRREQRKLVRY